MRLRTVLGWMGVGGWIVLGAGAMGAPAEGRLAALATTTLVADLVREIGGDRVAVEGLMGPGVDPHLYKASARDMGRLNRARVIFYSGLHLEGRMEEMLRRLRGRGRIVVGVAEAVPEAERLRAGDAGGAWDPHVWGDPALWGRAAEAVARGLTEADPGGAREYVERAAGYRERLETLRAWAVGRVGEIPERQRVLITSHDAFGYFGRAFGLEVVGVQGISTVAEASLSDITRLVDLVRARGLKAMFVESSVSPAAIERISRDAGVRIGGELFSDALGAPGEMRWVGSERVDVGTYLGMMRFNIHTVVEGLR